MRQVTDSACALRLRALRRTMVKAKLDGILITDELSRYYLTNFSGTAGTVLVTRDEAVLYTDFRYTERAREEVPECILVEEITGSLAKIVRGELSGRSHRLGIEDFSLTVEAHRQLVRAFLGVTLVGIGDAVQQLRKYKDDYELEKLQRAIAATDAVYKKTVLWLRTLKKKRKLPTELGVAHYVQTLAHDIPGGGLAFPTIVAAGKHAARPHHEPTAARLQLGQEVIIDLGVKLVGYHADMSRTVYLGEPTTAQRHRYETCLKAQTAALTYLRRGGRLAAKADAIARVIIDEVYPGAFGHSLGHGVGLEVHEAPTLSTGSRDILKNGMVFSVEPGIYETNKGGVRIEDLATVTSSGVTVLSRSPKTIKASIL
ncbi:MAG: Xaa-Pro peptidase family protein [Patescibacteria group bacterium]